MEKTREQIKKNKEQKELELLEAHNEQTLKKICKIDDIIREAVRKLTPHEIKDLRRFFNTRDHAVHIIQMAADTLNDLMREFE